MSTIKSKQRTPPELLDLGHVPLIYVKLSSQQGNGFNPILSPIDEFTGVVGEVEMPTYRPFMMAAKSKDGSSVRFLHVNNDITSKDMFSGCLQVMIKNTGKAVVANVYVAPEVRGYGIATNLILEAQRHFTIDEINPDLPDRVQKWLKKWL